MIADLATTACFAGLQQGICVVPYLAAGPAIHLAHGHTGRFGVSLGLRTGLAGLGATIGALSANCPERSAGGLDFCGLGEAAIGMVIGATVAAVIEPQLSFTRGGLNLGVGARF